jgi:hypothetical protein
MQTRWILGAVVVCLLSAAVSAGTAAVSADAGRQGPAPVTTPEGFDSTVFEIRVYENGSARWTLQHIKLLDNRSQVESFRSFADRFASTETDMFRNFRGRAMQLVAFGANETGHEMEATNFDRRAYVNQVGQTRGIVELSFLWTGFGQVTDDRIVVADIFEGGMFITDGQRLEFRRGPEVRFVDVDPRPDSLSVQGNLSASDSVTWFGERQFATRRPRVELVPSTAETGSGTAGDGQSASDGAGDENDDPGSTATPTASENTGTRGGAAGSGPGMVPIIAAAALLLGAIGGLAWYRGTLPDRRPGGGTGAGTAETTSTDGSTASATTASAESRPEEPTVSPEELLSDEDRVLSLLEENEGRMRQVAIVEETDWSKSKVSMLLSDMEDDGAISKLRVGRENIISLAGEEPEATKSPFDDE